jgi:phospholipid/cholesterol/gamma-HCH transport system ATP-binding protein
MSLIRFERVVKDLGGRRVLDGISLDVERGETLVILGSSGAGKSVTLKHMIRLMRPDRGRVWVDNECISHASSRDLERLRHKFGVLFQGAALLQWMSVFDNVALPLREKTKRTEAEIEGAVMARLEMLGVGDARDKLPADLSGGMQKRVGLARAMILEPEIILYDEPTSGLDPMTSRSIDNIIIDLNRRLGITSVVVTHDLHSALAIGHRIAVLHEGRFAELSAPERFVQSTHPLVRSFLESQYITRSGPWEAPTP